MDLRGRGLLVARQVLSNVDLPRTDFLRVVRLQEPQMAILAMGMRRRKDMKRGDDQWVGQELRSLQGI